MDDIKYGPCRCDGCRFAPTPVQLTNGLCGMCAEDGCEAIPPAAEPAGTEGDR